MIVVLRALTAVVAVLLPAALAIAGLAVAVFSISATGDLSLPGLAELIGLPAFEQTLGAWLTMLERPGPVAAIAALAGAGAVLVGLLLLAGVFLRRRERLVTLQRGEEGSVRARRRALGDAAARLVEQAEAVTRARGRARPRRPRGGTLSVSAQRTRTGEPADVRRAAEEALTPLTGPLPLRARVRTRQGQRGARVQ